jgi:hypothetical protein
MIKLIKRVIEAKTKTITSFFDNWEIEKETPVLFLYDYNHYEEWYMPLDIETVRCCWERYRQEKKTIIYQKNQTKYIYDYWFCEKCWKKLEIKHIRKWMK